MIARWLSLLTCLLAGLTLGGCGYQLGAPEGAATTYTLEPVRNRSLAPGSTALVDSALRQSLLQRGVSLNQGPSVTVILLDYGRRERGTAEDDTGRGLSFELYLKAEVQVEGRPPQTFEATTLALTEPNLPESEAAALPRLAEALARQIAGHLTQGW